MGFRLSFRGRCLVVDVRAREATYALEAGDAVEIVHHGETVEVRPDAAVTRPIPPPPRRDRPRQPPGREPRRRAPDAPGPAREGE
jgi:alpha,alpha-trehalose phosphorylase